MSVYRTKAELRLEEIEALQRPLTKAESNDLRRCLHAVYMRNWRVLKAVTGTGWGHFEAQRAAKREVDAIASRMEAAVDENWVKPEPAPSPCKTWQDKARQSSKCLCEAIKVAGVCP